MVEESVKRSVGKYGIYTGVGDVVMVM